MVDSNELFWPSLYSRLAPSRYLGPDYIDLDAGGPEEEAFGIKRFFTDFETLRRHIEIELETLLNASCLEAALLGAELHGLPTATVKRSDYPFEAYPRVQRSIINYGMPALIGQNVYALPVKLIEEHLRRAIAGFEPRIRPETMQVKIVSEQTDKPHPEQPLQIAISGEIMGTDGPLRVIINSLWEPDKIRSSVEIER